MDLLIILCLVFCSLKCMEEEGVDLYVICCYSSKIIVMVKMVLEMLVDVYLLEIVLIMEYLGYK